MATPPTFSPTLYFLPPGHITEYFSQCWGISDPASLARLGFGNSTLLDHNTQTVANESTPIFASDPDSGQPLNLGIEAFNFFYYVVMF